MSGRLATWRSARVAALQGDLAAHLVRGISGSFGVQAIGLVFSVASSVLLARAMGPAAYGYYAYALAWLEFLKVPVAYGHPLLVQRELAVRSAEGRWDVVRGLLRRINQAVLIVALTLAASFYVASGRHLIAAFTSDVQIRVFQIAVLMLPLVGLSAVRSGALNGLHRVTQGLLAENIVRPLLTASAVAAIWIVQGGVIAPATAMAVQVASVAVTFAVGAMLLRRALPADFRRYAPVYRTREWAAAAWPFMLTGGAYVVWGTLGVIMLGWYRSPDQVGVYRTATLIAGLALMPIVVFNTAVSPTIARLHAAGDRARMQLIVSYTTLALSAVTLLSLVGVALLGRFLLGSMFGWAFATGYGPLVALVAGHLLYATICNVMIVLDMSGHQRYSLYALAISALLNLALAPILIPRFGMTGAAIATGLSWFAGHLWLVPVVRRLTGIRATLLFAIVSLRKARPAA